MADGNLNFRRDLKMGKSKDILKTLLKYLYKAVDNKTELPFTEEIK